MGFHPAKIFWAFVTHACTMYSDFRTDNNWRILYIIIDLFSAGKT